VLIEQGQQRENGRVVGTALRVVLGNWEDLVYSLARPLNTLRLKVDTPGRRWLLRSPAMADGLTDPIWSIKELLTTVVFPVNP